MDQGKGKGEVPPYHLNRTSAPAHIHGKTSTGYRARQDVQWPIPFDFGHGPGCESILRDITHRSPDRLFLPYSSRRIQKRSSTLSKLYLFIGWNISKKYFLHYRENLDLVLNLSKYLKNESTVENATVLNCRFPLVIWRVEL